MALLPAPHPPPPPFQGQHLYPRCCRAAAAARAPFTRPRLWAERINRPRLFGGHPCRPCPTPKSTGVGTREAAAGQQTQERRDPKWGVKNGAGSGGNHQKRWLTQGASRGSQDPAAGRTRLIPLVASGREPGGPRQWCEPVYESRVPSSNPQTSLRVQLSQPRDQKRGEQSTALVQPEGHVGSSW